MALMVCHTYFFFFRAFCTRYSRFVEGISFEMRIASAIRPHSGSSIEYLNC